jgi:predicted alpha/beta-fold hydrolase
MEWLGQAKISYYHSPSPLVLKTKDGAFTDLLTVCSESTPPCQLNPLLFNGHLQTFWTAMKNDGPPLYYKRKVFEAEDPAYEGSFTVDFVTTSNSGSDATLPIRTTYFSDEEYEEFQSLDKRPMLVALHGLAGGSDAIYVKHGLAPLTGLDGEGQWEACVVNSRGCAESKITSPLLYNARATWDCRQTVSWLRKKFPNRPLFGIGFSLGANILTNYVAEEGSSCILKVPSTPFIWAVIQNSNIHSEGCSSHFESVELGRWLDSIAEDGKEILIYVHTPLAISTPFK